MWGVVALHCSVQSLKTWKPFSFHSQVKIVYLLSQPFFGWFTLSEISSLTTLKQCKTGIFYLKCLKRFDWGHGAVPHVTDPEHWLAWNLMSNVTDAQMLFFFYSRVVTRLHSPTYEFNKLMENTWQHISRAKSSSPFAPSTTRCSFTTFREVNFLTKCITW